MTMLRKAMRFPENITIILLSAFLVMLLGCGTGGLSDTPAAAGGGGAGRTTTPPPPPPAAAISLGTDAVAVKSDDSSTATITATVLDVSNAVIKDADVAFKATGGAISASSVKTNANGRA